MYILYHMYRSTDRAISVRQAGREHVMYVWLLVSYHVRSHTLDELWLVKFWH